MSFWLPVDFSNKQEGCKAVLRFNQGGSQTASLFLGPQPHFPERSTGSADSWAQRRASELRGAFGFSPPHLLSYQTDMGSKKEVSLSQLFGGAKFACEQFSYLDENFSRVLFAGHNLDWPSWNLSCQPDRENITNVYSSVSRHFG